MEQLLVDLGAVVGFDLVAAKYSAKVNGLTGIAITKLDILNSFKTIKVCTHYDVNGKKIKNMTEALNNLDIVKPIYKEFPGWNTELKILIILKVYLKVLKNILNIWS